MLHAVNENVNYSPFLPCPSLTPVYASYPVLPTNYPNVCTSFSPLCVPPLPLLKVRDTVGEGDQDAFGREEHPPALQQGCAGREESGRKSKGGGERCESDQGGGRHQRYRRRELVARSERNGGGNTRSVATHQGT